MSDFYNKPNEGEQQEVALEVLKMAQAREKDVAQKLGIDYAQLQDVLEDKADAIVTITYDNSKVKHLEDEISENVTKNVTEVPDVGNQDVVLTLLELAQTREQVIADKLGIEYAQLKDVLEGKAQAQVLVAYSNKEAKKVKVYAKANGYRKKRTLRRTIAIVASFVMLLSVGFVSITYATPIQAFLQKTFGIGQVQISAIYDKAPIDLKGFYLPQYVPKDFTTVKYDTMMDEEEIARDADGFAIYPLIEVNYNSTEGAWILYTYTPYTEASFHFYDTEDSGIVTTTIGGQGFSYITDDYGAEKYLSGILQNGDQVRLRGAVSIEELLKVAESIMMYGAEDA